MQGVRWPSAAPAPQLFMGPRVDRIHDKGPAHWGSYRERHGFDGIHITCAGLPLGNTGIKAVANRMPYTWVWPWGDEQSGQTPAGGLVGSVALRYYDKLERILGHLGHDRLGFGAGFDLHEWVAGGDHAAAVDEMLEWVEHMLERFPGCMIGGRALASDGPWPGTYAGFEHAVEVKGNFRRLLGNAVTLSAGVPTFTEDRFRERGSSRAKDWTQTEMLELGMPATLEARVAAIWAVLDGADQDAGCIDFDDPEAVRELLEGDEPLPPPDGDKCMPAATYAAELRGIEERLQDEIIDPIEAEYTASSWRGRLLAMSGITRYLKPTKALIAEAELVIEEMETCTPPDAGGNGNGGNGNGGSGSGNGEPVNELKGVKSLGADKQWRPGRYAIEGTLESVELTSHRIVARWPGLSRALYPMGDFGPFDPGEKHFGRLYVVAMVDGELAYWGIEWLRRENETISTTVGADEGKDIIGTFARKARGNGVSEDWRPRPVDEVLGFFFASPLVKKRSNVVWVDIPR